MKFKSIVEHQECGILPTKRVNVKPREDSIDQLFAVFRSGMLGSEPAADVKLGQNRETYLWFT